MGQTAVSSRSVLGLRTSRSLALSRRAILGGAAVLVIGGVAGVLSVEYGILAASAASGIALIGWVLHDHASMIRGERILTSLLLFGGFVLGYGFANLGLRAGPIPLPATEILFLPLLLLALSIPRTRPPARVLVPLLLFGVIVLLRLVVDYPRWGILAVRDATIGLEIFMVAVGYRSVLRDGLDRSIARMGFVMTAVLVYGGFLYPWRTLIEEAGPTVGLQREVSLLDSRGTKYAVIAAALYFLVFSRGWKRALAAGLVVGLVGAFQARTLYVLMPLSVLALGWARRQTLRTATRFVPVVLVGVLAIVLMSRLSIEGRRGPVDPGFIEAHARTLLGEEGPMAGSISSRGDWFRLTVDEITRSPTTILVGVGLGPDLTFGTLRGEDGEAVRSPHNDYLEVVARLGVLGFLSFLTVLGGCLFATVRKARSGDGPAERFCAWIFASCIVYLGVAGAQSLLSFPYGSVPLFFMLGMGAAVAHRDPQPDATRSGGPI